MPGSPLRDTSVLGRIDGIPVMRLAAMHGLERTVDLVSGAIRQAVAQKQPHLLVDTTALAFAPPSLAVRHRIVRQWADAANGRLRLAVVVRPDCIDPEHFAVVAAANFGLPGQLFDQEPDALAWLQAEHAADLRAGSDTGSTVHTTGDGAQPSHDRH